MAVTRRTERQLLDRTELELVEGTHHPEIARLSVEVLAARRRLLRDYRDKSRDRARQQRREMRGKAEARATAPARENAGTAMKQEILGQALKRVNRELARRAEA